MTSESEQKDQAVSQNDTGVKRRGLLRFGTLITALTGASAMSAISANSAQAGPGDKTPPSTYVPISEKGAPLGVATLDAASKILPSQVPDLSATYVGKGDLVFNVRDYGAKGDGVTDDTAVIQSVVDLAANKGSVYFPISTSHYVCNGVTLPSNTHLFSSIPGGQGGGAYIRRTVADTPIFIIAGTTYLTGGPQKTNIILSQLNLRGSRVSGAMLDMAACSRVRLDRVKFQDTTGMWIRMREVFDSRLNDCEFEAGGTTDGTIPGISLESGGGYEYTNNVYFNDCKFEAYAGTALASLSNGTNKIIFNTCKFEAGSARVPQLVFTNATDVQFNSVQIGGGDSSGGTVPSLVKFAGMTGLAGRIMLQATGNNTAAFTTYADLATSKDVDLDISVLPWGPTPANGTVITWDGANNKYCDIRLHTSGLLSPTVRAVTSGNTMVVWRANTMQETGGTMTTNFAQKRGDVSDVWNLGNIILDGAKSSWRFMHDAASVFRIQSNDVFVFDRGYVNKSLTVPVVADGAITLDGAVANHFYVTLSANVTAASLFAAGTGQNVTLTYVQDATGGRRYVWPSVCRFAGGVAPNTTTASTSTSVTFANVGGVLMELARSVGVPA
jgi:hypothetical protein